MYKLLVILLFNTLLCNMKPIENNPLTRKKKESLPTVPFTEGSDLLGFFNSWMQSPEYNKRLQQNQYNPSMQSNRLNALGNTEFSYGTDATSIANAPINAKSKAFVHVNPNEARQLGVDPQTVKAHELSHATGAVQGFVNPFVGINPYETDIIKKSITREKPQPNTRDYSEWSHMNQPHEIKADLDATRWNMFKKGVYDIREGNPFGKEHLNKAKELFKDDNSFKRLLKQVGEDNYIELMNTIASNKDNKEVLMAAYGGMINPMQEQYSFGGILGGAVKGAGSLSFLGAPGMIGGALLGGVSSFFKGRKEKKDAEKMEAEQSLQQQGQVNMNTLADMNYGFVNSSNLPMAMGGLTNMTDTPVGSSSHFAVGGTHESNPHGGIPQGKNPQGQLRTLEEGEVKFRFKDGDYVFSNRLTV